MMNVLRIIFLKDLKVSLRRWSDLSTSFILFILVCLIFPLTLGNDPSLLLKIIGPVILVSALLATLLAMQNIFRPDVLNGSLEQLTLNSYPLTLIICTKIFSFWVITSLPLILISGFIASSYYVTGNSILIVVLTLLLSTPSLVHISALAAALTVAIRYPGALMALIIIPLSLPIMIFGAKAIEFSISGIDASAPLYFLLGMMFFTCSLGPMVTASAIRISID
jgi:heme exporter protein B